MRFVPKTYRGAGVLASCLLMLGLGTSVGHGDEPQGGSRLARLFRFGQGGSNNGQAAAGHNHNHDVDPGQPGNGPSTAYPSAAMPGPASPPSTPNLPPSGPTPRINPQPRVSRPPTEADPIITRIAVGRSDNGSQFGMFLQVFADGTVIDLEGVHRVGADLMRPLLDSLRQGEVYRLKGHCGAPSTDFIEVAHLVVYERSYGKLRATSFSYSGNPQGCDPSVRKVHAALEAIQVRLSPPASAPAPTSQPAQAPGTPVLSLTPPSGS